MVCPLSLFPRAPVAPHSLHVPCEPRSSLTHGPHCRSSIRVDSPGTGTKKDLQTAMNVVRLMRGYQVSSHPVERPELRFALVNHAMSPACGDKTHGAM